MVGNLVTDISSRKDAIYADEIEGKGWLKNTFAPGMYIRELFMPAGMVVVSKIHKTSYPNFLLQGKIAVTTTGSDEQAILEGPTYFVSPKGIQKVGIVLEDATWVTVHATKSTDLDEIENEVIAKSYDEIDKELE